MIKNKQRERYGLVFLLAILVSAVIFVPYIIIDKGYFFFFGDFNVQQIPFYQLAHRAVRSGDIFWSWYTDLGANFIGSYSFYLLGSPFFLLTLPFPTEWVPYLMGPLLMLKMGCAAVTSYGFITRFVKNKNLAVLGGLLYAFSGFSVYNIFFNHFHEAIIVFPLMLIGLEELMQNDRRGFFALSIAAAAVTNYFFFAGQAVFLIIYFIIRLSTGDFKLTFKRFFCLAVETILGLGLAAFMLMPSALAVLANPRVETFETGWRALFYNNVQRYGAIIQTFFFPPDLPSRPNFFPDGNVKWASVAGWLPFVSMGGVIAFMQSKKRNFIKRIIYTCAFIALVPILNSMFYMFNDSYYARWFYMPILFMALATVIGFEDREIDMARGLRWNLFITAGITVAIGTMPYHDEGVLKIGLEKYPDRFWISCAIALFCAVLMIILFRVFDNDGKKLAVYAVVLTCIFSAGYACYFVGIGKTHSYTTKYITETALNRGDDFELPETLNQFWRADVYEGMDNQAMFWGMPNIQAFHSIVPASIMEFYPSIGVQRDVGSRPEPEHYGLRSLTSVKWLFVNSAKSAEQDMPGFKYHSTQNGYWIFENENYIPMGFTYDDYITEADYYDTPKSTRDRLLVRSILLTPEGVTRNSDILRRSTEEFYDPDEAEFADWCDKRSADSCYLFETTKNGFKAEINLTRENLVFFSVPYDEGFTAYVNGEKAQIEKANVGFMAVRAPKGKSQIVFTYETPGLIAGIQTSLVALLAFLLYFIPSTILFYRKRRKDEAEKQREALALAAAGITPESSQPFFISPVMPKNQRAQNGFAPTMPAPVAETAVPAMPEPPIIETAPEQNTELTRESFVPDYSDIPVGDPLSAAEIKTLDENEVASFDMLAQADEPPEATQPVEAEVNEQPAAADIIPPQNELETDILTGNDNTVIDNPLSPASDTAGSMYFPAGFFGEDEQTAKSDENESYGFSGETSSALFASMFGGGSSKRYDLDDEPAEETPETTEVTVGADIIRPQDEAEPIVETADQPVGANSVRPQDEPADETATETADEAQYAPTEQSVSAFEEEPTLTPSSTSTDSMYFPAGFFDEAEPVGADIIPPQDEVTKPAEEIIETTEVTEPADETADEAQYAPTEQSVSAFDEEPTLTPSSTSTDSMYFPAGFFDEAEPVGADIIRPQDEPAEEISETTEVTEPAEETATEPADEAQYAPTEQSVSAFDEEPTLTPSSTSTDSMYFPAGFFDEAEPVGADIIRPQDEPAEETPETTEVTEQPVGANSVRPQDEVTEEISETTEVTEPTEETADETADEAQYAPTEQSVSAFDEEPTLTPSSTSTDSMYFPAGFFDEAEPVGADTIPPQDEPAEEISETTEAAEPAIETAPAFEPSAPSAIPMQTNDIATSQPRPVVGEVSSEDENINRFFPAGFFDEPAAAEPEPIFTPAPAPQPYPSPAPAAFAAAPAPELSAKDQKRLEKERIKREKQEKIEKAKAEKQRLKEERIEKAAEIRASRPQNQNKADAFKVQSVEGVDATPVTFANIKKPEAKKRDTEDYTLDMLTPEQFKSMLFSDDDFLQGPSGEPFGDDENN